jgi:hypothetical protein
MREPQHTSPNTLRRSTVSVRDALREAIETSERKRATADQRIAAVHAAAAYQVAQNKSGLAVDEQTLADVGVGSDPAFQRAASSYRFWRDRTRQLAAIAQVEQSDRIIRQNDDIIRQNEQIIALLTTIAQSRAVGDIHA